MAQVLAGKKLKVLIADDDKDLLEMLVDIFTSDGMDVVSATDGLDAWVKYGEQEFDAVITDIKMPKKDGLKFVEEIRNLETEKKNVPGNSFVSIPIFLISASIDDYRQSIDRLANIEVIAKPFRPVEALRIVRKVLKGSQSKDSQIDSVKLSAGEYVMREGDLSTDIFYVKSGQLKVTKKSSNNTEVTICTVKAGEIVGELGFLLHKPRSASVVAVLDTELVPIPKDKFDQIFCDQPKWFKMLFETIAARLEDTTQFLVEERSKTKT